MYELEEEYAAQVQFVYSDFKTYEGKLEAARYSINGTPATVLLDQAGKPLKVMPGLRSKEALVSALKAELAHMNGAAR